MCAPWVRRVSLVQFPDGTWNLPPGLTGPAEKQGLAVRVGELVIQSGLFELEGRQMGMDGRLEDFALQLTSSRRNRYSGTLACRKAELKLPKAEPLIFGLDLSFRLDPERGASIDDFRAVGEFGDIHASGARRDPQEPHDPADGVGRRPHLGDREDFPIQPRASRATRGSGPRCGSLPPAACASPAIFRLPKSTRKGF